MRAGCMTGRCAATLLGTVITAAALAGCASSSSGSSPSRTSTPPAAAPAATSSTMAPPQGNPIELAMITQESGPAALPDSRLAAEAAVKYVNAELGGAAGRPLKLDSCVTDGSPEQSASCANTLLAQNPVAFVGEGTA